MPTLLTTGSPNASRAGVMCFLTVAASGVFATGAFSAGVLAGVLADWVPEPQPIIANSSRTSGEILMLETFLR
ncbi:MAG TPA: hypothetical protein EYQ75_23795 [Planctomycetaceae bacterium]|nr:hypothetical protein [Planctomycetaceae bacterium]